MLSPEQIKEIRLKAGLNPNPNAKSASQRIEEVRSRVRAKQVEQQTTGNQFTETSPVKTPTTLPQKARNVATTVIGGGKLAEGLGLSVAAPKLQRELSKAEQDASDIDLKLIKRIQEKKARGEDTFKLEQAREQLHSDMKVTRDVQNDFVESLPTNKEIIGSAARLGGTLAGGAIAGGVTKGGSFTLQGGKLATKIPGVAQVGEKVGGLTQLTGAGKATTALGGLGRGAAAGAMTGAAEGAIQGAGLAAEANKSSEEILYSGLLGAVAGAATGGIIGAGTGAISGGLKGRAIKREQFTTDLVSPKMSVKDRAKAIYEGRLKDPTMFSKAEIQMSKRDAKLAEAVKDVVSPKATIGQNVDAIRQKIDQTDNGVQSYIQSNKVPFNMKQLRSKLETGKGDLRLIFASDSNAEKTYDAVTDAFMETIKKGDTEGLFNARQNFDQIPAIQKLLQNDRLGENARKEIVLSVRRAANEYIANQLPQGNPYKQAMLQQSYALEALSNLADKSATIIGKNNLQILTDKYPIMKWLIGGVGAGLAGSAGIGVGSAIIGSTD